MHGNGVSGTHKKRSFLAESKLKVSYLPKNLKDFRADEQGRHTEKGSLV